MNIQKVKLLSLFFFMLMMLGIVFSIFLFVKLEERNNEIHEINIKLKATEDKLSHELSKRKSNTDKTDSNPEANLKSVEEVKNSVFKFGVYSVGLTRQKNIVESYLRQKNYTIAEQHQFEKPPEWFSTSGPTIFYYSKTNLVLAKKIKKDLDKKLGVSFKIMRGAGYGVKESERAIKLNIHLIKTA